MNAPLVSIATGLCAAPLLSLAGFAITNLLARPGGGGSDQTIAHGYLGLLAGIALAVIGFFVFWYSAQRFVPQQQMRYLIAADVVVLIAGIAAWHYTLASAPRVEYPAGRAVLQVEARIPKAILADDPIDAVASIDFAGGEDLSDPHPEGARADGDAVILPWETTPIRVRAWQIRVFVRGAPLLFELPLARMPESSAEWSQWIRPAAREGSSSQDAVMLRYRFQVLPHEEARHR
jgi:hypothetical protein